MRTKYYTMKIDMLRGAYRIKIIHMYIFMMHLKLTNLYIFHISIRQIEYEKFRWNHAKSQHTIKLVRKFL